MLPGLVIFEMTVLNSSLVVVVGKGKPSGKFPGIL